MVYKTGENEYYINNEKCRLKDITNLFLDSRSSKESFNIIPQNKIDQILSEKPEERRTIFEDASKGPKFSSFSLIIKLILSILSFVLESLFKHSSFLF